MTAWYGRKRTDPVRAIQWNGQNLGGVQEFMFPQSPLTQSHERLGVIVTGFGLNSLEFMSIGDWLVKDSEGCIAIMKQDTFERTYKQLPNAEEADRA